MKCLIWLLAAIVTVAIAFFFGRRFVIGLLAWGFVFGVGFVAGLMIDKHTTKPPEKENRKI